MKKIKIIGIFIVFGLSFVSHFMYNLFPYKIFSIFFPVNESIWEHMKLIITPVLIFSFGEYIFFRRKNIFFNNFILSYSISICFGIFFYLLIYLSINYFVGHNAIIAISLLFFIFCNIEVISYYIINYKKLKYSKTIGIIIILLLYIIFGYLTYNPLNINIFYDAQKNIYGIPK